MLRNGTGPGLLRRRGASVGDGDRQKCKKVWQTDDNIALSISSAANLKQVATWQTLDMIAVPSRHIAWTAAVCHGSSHGLRFVI